jgi:Uma2 family endonuclease
MLLTKLFADAHIIYTQNPIRLSDLSEPQPDITLLRWRDDFYRRALPQPEDVLLVIEVADTTVETDRAVKLPLYARAGINEVWLVNPPAERIELYAAPAAGAYQTVKYFQRGEDVQAQTIPNLVISVADVLG